MNLSNISYSISNLITLSKERVIRLEIKNIYIRSMLEAETRITSHFSPVSNLMLGSMLEAVRKRHVRNMLETLRTGVLWRGRAWQGQARQGSARRGSAWQGSARQGKKNKEEAFRMAETRMLSELVLEYTLYPRVDVSDEHVSGLIATIRSGYQIPPIKIDKQNRVIDGFHRYRAYEKLKIETIPVEVVDVSNNADFYLEAVRLNATHGRPLSTHEKKKIALDAERLGISREKISEVLRVSVDYIERITVKSISRSTLTGMPVPLKRGLEPLAGRQISPKEEKLVKEWGGMNLSFYVRQVLMYLEAGLEVSPGTAVLLDKVVELWSKRKEEYVVSDCR